MPTMRDRKSETKLFEKGQLVRYWKSGWYVGHIEKLKGTKAKGYHSVEIKPIGPIGRKPHNVTIPITDVKLED